MIKLLLLILLTQASVASAAESFDREFEEQDLETLIKEVDNKPVKAVQVNMDEFLGL